MGRKSETENKKKMGRPAALLLLFFVLGGLAAKALWGGGGTYRDCVPQADSPCRVYYLLNIDGMKGLGHAALLLVDENGEGRLFSYNGMEYNLIQCLLGKEGMGRMKEFRLDGETLKDFLESGELPAGEYEECADFDRALWREITREEYALVEGKALHYIEAEEEYQRLRGELYALEEKAVLENDAALEEGAAPENDAVLEEGAALENDAALEEEAIPENDAVMKEAARERLEKFRAREDTPLYQIYTHNCDTAARELIAEIDGDMEAYNATQERLTPKGNFKNMCRKLGDAWGSFALGEDTWVERLLY